MNIVTVNDKLKSIKISGIESVKTINIQVQKNVPRSKKPNDTGLHHLRLLRRSNVIIATAHTTFTKYVLSF